MEDNKKNPVDRFLERSDLGELESSIAARLVNGKQQLDETQAALQRLRDEQLKIEQRFVGLSHQVKAMADLAAELQARHENKFAQTNEVVVSQTTASAG
jgi:predicted  nucleic acid-binding Zn-ribbon protein